MHTEVGWATRRALIFLILLTAAVRLVLGFRYFGFHTGDDVEIIEAGLMRVFDLHYLPLPVRNLLISDLLVAPILASALALGVENPSSLVWAASFPFVALASVNILLVFAIGLRWLHDQRAALCAAALYAFHWMPLGYGSMVYPRTVSTTSVLLAVWLLAGKGRGGWRAAAAGGLAALAFAFRYSEGVYLLPLLALLLSSEKAVRDKIRDTLVLLSSFAVACVLTAGLHDWITWGTPFASLVELGKFALIQQQTTALYVDQPWYWFLRRVPKWIPLTLLPFLITSAKRQEARHALAFVVLPLLVFSAIDDKQLRYIQGTIPFVCLAAACGAWLWWEKGHRRSTAWLLALSLLLSPGGLTFLQKKSMAATKAAHFLVADPGAACVALAQPWAYGNRLFFAEETELRALPFRPSVADLDRVVRGCGRVGLYAEHALDSPELAGWLEAQGYRLAERFHWGRSRDVILYALEPTPRQNDGV